MITLSLNELVTGTFKGFGQIFFSSNFYSSVLIFIGISVYSRLSAMMGLFGSFWSIIWVVYIITLEDTATATNIWT